MQNTLYIIGNGFDLNHGLKTSYLDFKKNYAMSKPALWRVLEKFYGNKLKKDLWWSNFEKMLGEVDYQHLANSRNGGALGHKVLEDFFSYNLRFWFGDWIKGVNQREIRIISSAKRNDVIVDALFFTFNYTTLLEDVYQIDRDNIWHIHGSVLDLQHDEHSIVVGHDSNFGQLMGLENTQEAQKVLSGKYIDDANVEVAKGAKDVKKRVEDNSGEFIKRYSLIKHYIIMGFSLNDIDMPYIEKIIEVNHDIDAADWTFYYYKEEEKCAFMESLLKLGIKQENINKPIQW
jgi:hypothetical protein